MFCIFVLNRNFFTQRYVSLLAINLSHLQANLSHADGDEAPERKLNTTVSRLCVFLNPSVESKFTNGTVSGQFAWRLGTQGNW